MQGIGVDICDVSRFEKLKHNQAFLERVFSTEELAYCLPKKRAAESLASRFAAKEAFVKALGTGLREGLRLVEIEVNKDELGKPFFKFYGRTSKIVAERDIHNTMLSLSHEKTMAIAMVVIQ